MVKFITFILSLLLSFTLATESPDQWLEAPSANPGKKPVVVTSGTIDKHITGLRVNDPKKTFKGYTLLTPLVGRSDYSGMCSIDLVDMDGIMVYRWIVENSPSPSLGRLTETGKVIFSNQNDSNSSNIAGLKELDAESNQTFIYRGILDHEFQIIDNDTFLIARDEPVQTPAGSPFPLKHMSSPRIILLTRDGRVIWEWKAEEHLDELVDLPGFYDIFAEFKSMAASGAGEGFIDSSGKLCYQGSDWAHNNTAMFIPPNPLEEKDPRFKSGNILFCFCGINLIGILEYPSGKIVWAWGPGELDNPHTPSMVDNGNILIFDNGARRKWSRVIEMDPATGKIVWEYHAEPKNSFFSDMLSSAQRLPNGNTFICEGLSERVFEITPKGEIVWDYLSTYAKLTGGMGFYRAYKYSPEYAAPLLGSKEQEKK
ncbi:MAG: aryl-sulfate sulfotransferase [Candidatus Omnitrophica bacterium]|nr:aryl-sulfate sulfotransferase [Candidatus Omnitrophota bacterium]